MLDVGIARMWSCDPILEKDSNIGWSTMTGTFRPIHNRCRAQSHFVIFEEGSCSHKDLILRTCEDRMLNIQRLTILTT